MRALVRIGHEVVVLEPETEWSIDNLRGECQGARLLREFSTTYPELKISTYRRILQSRSGVSGNGCAGWTSSSCMSGMLRSWLRCCSRSGSSLGTGCCSTTHITGQSSSPEQMQRFGLPRFDGIVAFGEALSEIYRDRFGLSRVWTLHEAADTSVFRPYREVERQDAIAWVGNWGENERAAELREFVLAPASALTDAAQTTVYGMRYPEEALEALSEAGVAYGGYLPNLDAPAVYARAKATVHVPRQQYAGAMHGIPTIRVFEALACGLPLVSAPWVDSEGLFRPGDLRWAADATEMCVALRTLLRDKAAAEDQARRGLETVQARHT